MQDEEITPSPEYIKAFNNGYIIKKYAPKILADILNPIAQTASELKEGLIHGAREAVKESLREDREQREQRQENQNRPRRQ